MGLLVASVVVTLLGLEGACRIAGAGARTLVMQNVAPIHAAGHPFTVLGIGESSMIGEPYDTRFTFLDLVGLELRRSHPRQQIATELVARKGATLDSLLVDALAAIARRPSAVVVFAGHNDFHGAFAHRAACSSRSDTAYKLLRHSALFRFVRARVARHGIGTAPVASERAFFDRPIVCPAEWDDVLAKYGAAASSIAAACHELRIPAVFVFPAGNEVEFNPNRSVFAGSSAERLALREQVTSAWTALYAGDVEAMARSLDAHAAPSSAFGELTFVRGRLALLRGDGSTAASLFEQAKEQDGFPWRALEAQRVVLKDVARRHALRVVDGRIVIARASRTHQLDAEVFHDIHHPTLEGYLAVARATSAALDEERPPGLNTRVEAPPLTAADVLEELKFSSGDAFELFATRVRWFDVFSDLSFDPSTRLFLLLDNLSALRALNPAMAEQVFPAEFEDRIRQRLQSALATYGVDGAQFQRLLASREPLLTRYPYLRRSDVAPVHLDGLPSLMHLGRGTVEDGLCTDGAPLRVGGKMIPEGFCANPPSDVVFRLGRAHSRLGMVLAMADGSHPTAKANCKIVADGRVLRESAIVRASGGEQALDLDVSEVDELHLLCDDGGDGWEGDHVAWYSPKLTPKTARVH